jgi:hypothetical protein
MGPPLESVLRLEEVQAAVAVVATGKAVAAGVAAPTWTSETPSVAEVDRATAGGIETEIATGIEIFETASESESEIVIGSETETLIDVTVLTDEMRIDV